MKFLLALIIPAFLAGSPIELETYLEANIEMLDYHTQEMSKKKCSTCAYYYLTGRLASYKDVKQILLYNQKVRNEKDELQDKLNDWQEDF